MVKGGRMDIIAIITIIGFVLGLIIQIVSVGIFIGVYKTTIAFMQKQIEELKNDMRKYNNVLERLIKAESNIKALWRKADEQ